MVVLDPLRVSIDRLRAAAERAVGVLPNDDIRDVHTQALKAVELVRELAGVDDEELALKLLHSVNNKLTGVLSLTALCLEDLESDATQAGVRQVLRDVEAIARDAANRARDVSLGLKGDESGAHRA